MPTRMTSEPREFPETHWSQLLELRNPAHPRHAEHLDGLVQQYWKPAYLYLRAIRAMSASALGVSAATTASLAMRFMPSRTALTRRTS